MRLTELDSGDAALPLYRVDNGAIALVFLPAVGGRLLSLAAGGRELLWRNPAHFDDALRAVLPRAGWPALDGTFASWANVGGAKTWPAPQGWGGEGEWAGPPDAVLDSGIWSIEAVESEEGIAVTMASPADPRSGIRITRRFTVPQRGEGFSLETTFTNVVDHAVTWSIWEVAQVDTAAGAGLPIADAAVLVATADESVVDLGTYRGAPSHELVDGSARFAIREGVAKRGFPSATGRVAYESPTGGLEVGFRPQRGGIYPDSGSRAELWLQSPLDAPIEELSGLHPAAWLAELEVLSPLSRIAPGRSFSFATTWRALLP